MNVHDVQGFLSKHAPFDLLPERQLNRISQQVEIIYVNDHNIASLSRPQRPFLMVIRSGLFQLKQQDQLTNFAKGDVVFPVAPEMHFDVKEAGLIYLFDQTTISSIEQLSDQFSLQLHQLSKGGLINANSVSNDWTQQPLAEHLTQSPISIDISQNIRQASELMSSHDISSLLVTDNQELVGIITDRDLRSRVLAKQLDGRAAVNDIMTAQPHSLSPQQTLFDAMNLMLRFNIHHVPVIDSNGHKPVGMITSSDLIRLQGNDASFLIKQLHQANTVADLIALSHTLVSSLKLFAQKTQHISLVSELLAVYTDVLTQRLIWIFTRTIPINPEHYVWLAFGSHARREQTLHSDQDNGLLMANESDLSTRQQLAEMAEFVCLGLAKCGISICPGNIMASNPDLQLTLCQWQAKMQTWVESPTPESVLASQIFLDERPIYGSKTLYKQYKKQKQAIINNDIFLAALARKTAEIHVPINLFHRFVFEQGRHGKKQINLKTRAIVLINDLVRIYAIANEIEEANTLARIRCLQVRHIMSQSDAENLQQIWQFLHRLCIHQQLFHDTPEFPHHIDIRQLTSLDRHQLKEAMLMLKVFQQALNLHFNRGG